MDPLLADALTITNAHRCLCLPQGQRFLSLDENYQKGTVLVQFRTIFVNNL